MNPAISAEIDGRHVPLADCGWVLYARCGCPLGVTMAESGMRVLGTEESAFRVFYDCARDVEQAKRRGEHAGLMEAGRIRAEVLPSFGNRCPHVKDSSEGERE